MNIAETLLLDFDAEARSTRRALERVPEGQNDWKPHEKSMKLGALASHITTLPALGNLILTTDNFDFASGSFPRYEFTTAAHAVEHAAGLGAELRSSLHRLSDSDLLQHWHLNFKDKPVATGQRAVLYRTMFLNHLVHHRGQLTVYLRLLGIPVPGLYGPSADEPFAM